MIKNHQQSRSHLQLTQTRQIQRRPIKQIQRLPNPTPPRRRTAIIRAIKQQFQIRPFLLHNLIQKLRPIRSSSGQRKTIREGRSIAVEDRSAAVVVRRADIVSAEGAIVSRDGARDVGFCGAVDGERGPLVCRHGGGEDEGAETEGEEVRGRGQGEVIRAGEEAVGGEARERRDVGHDGG